MQVGMKRSRQQRRYDQLRHMVNRYLATSMRKRTPKDLSDGCRYVLLSGGKRIRSTLVLLSCEAVGGRATDALAAGAAVEMMHNFTLVHDDIMDHAATRRGRPTLHTKWDINNALLVGDVLIGQASRSLLRTKTPHLHRILDLFASALIDVCEGQALDLEFECTPNVTLKNYVTMIEKKTARLISMSTELGAIIGGGTPPQVAALHRFGHFLGRAFQIQDDLLDVIADEKHFGKNIGGDIVEGKKTFLLLKTLERARGDDKRLLQRIMMGDTRLRRNVAHVTALYSRYGAIDAAQQQIRRDTRRANEALTRLPRTHAVQTLRWLSEALVKRIS
jgi:geranylgeranyl diphosphate synthase, type II